MTERLLQRRLIGGPILAALFAFAVWVLVQEMHRSGLFTLSILTMSLAIGPLFSIAIVHSDRRTTPMSGPPLGVAAVVVAIAIGLFFLRFAPPGFLLAVVALGFAASVGMMASAVYELRRGTYRHP